VCFQKLKVHWFWFLVDSLYNLSYQQIHSKSIQWSLNLIDTSRNSDRCKKLVCHQCSALYNILFCNVPQKITHTLATVDRPNVGCWCWPVVNVIVTLTTNWGYIRLVRGPNFFNSTQPNPTHDITNVNPIQPNPLTYSTDISSESHDIRWEIVQNTGWCKHHAMNK